MPSQTFLPNGENPQIDWLTVISENAPALAAKYNLTKPQTDDMVAGLAFLIAWHTYKIALVKHAQEVTTYYVEQAHGVAVGKTGSVMPVQPALPTVIAPPPDIIGRASAIARSIKAQTAYTQADGQLLGIIGPENNIDYSSLKAQITIKLVNGGHPEIDWLKHGLDGVQIWKDSGTGTFSLLSYSAHPPTMDNSPLPPAGTSAVWRYKAIYMHHDGQVGNWSDVVSVTVTGS